MIRSLLLGLLLVPSLAQALDLNYQHPGSLVGETHRWAGQEIGQTGVASPDDFTAPAVADAMQPGTVQLRAVPKRLSGLGMKWSSGRTGISVYVRGLWRDDAGRAPFCMTTIGRETRCDAGPNLQSVKLIPAGGMVRIDHRY